MTEPPATSTADLMLTVSEEHTQHWEQRALAAEAEVDRLRDDLADARRVIEQLKRYHYNDDTGYCNEDGFVWPCHTFRALSASGTDRTGGDER